MTRIVILAAGEGTRLRPLTNHLPKTLVSLGGVTLLSQQMAVLQQAGITDICVVGGYCAEHLDAKGIRLFLNPNYASTNMVASLYCAKSLFDGTDDVVIAYGDIVYEPRVLAALLAATVDGIAVVVDLGWKRLWQMRMDDPLSDAETMKLDASGHIVELGRKPNSLADVEGQYIGLFKVSRSFAPTFFERYEKLPEDAMFEGRSRDKMHMTSYLQHQIDHGVQVLAAKVTNGWLEVDSIQDLERYEGALARGELAQLYNGGI